MANYATLKSAIKQVIKTNENNEITGALLQQSLLAMINSLGVGYQYMGMATPSTNPGTPDQNVFYFATEAGTYSNFGGVVLPAQKLAILCWDGTWHLDSVQIGGPFIPGDGTNSAQLAGTGAKANGPASVAEGSGSKATGYFSHAEGTSTLASNHSSHAEGYQTVAGTDERQAYNIDATAGYFTHAEGNGTRAYGNSSHAEGKGTEANGNASHAEGAVSKATGNYSHAEGFNTKANETTSHAEGHKTIASGANSHAEGAYCEAKGEMSHVEGFHTETNNASEHAEGSYNKSNTDTRHSVGIGSSESDRKNAFEVMQNGDIYVIGLGGYDGTNPGADGVLTLQQLLASL